MAEKYTSTAKVIDGVLIISLPDAVTPVVWQMELGQSKSSALEIRTANDNHFILTLKTPRQDVLDIAAYDNRDMAIKALLVISQAMEKAQGQLKSPATPYSYPVPAVTAYGFQRSIGSVFKKIFKILAMTAAAIISLGLILFVIMTLFSLIQGMTGASTGTAAGNGPVSADEFLENR